MASIRDLSRGDIDNFLAERPLSSRGSRAFMVALLDLSTGTAAPEVGVELLRAELARRSGGAISAAAFRKQLSRVNNSLSAAAAPFTLVTRGSRVAVVPTEHWDRATQLDSVQRALVSHSGDKMRGDLDSFVTPRAIPDRLLVMWSYAWLHPEQQELQLEIFDQLKRKLAAPPQKYRHLPKIEIWRDEERMGPGDPAGAGADEACRAAILALIVFSDRYPHSEPCLQEAEHFLDDEGNPKGDKRYIVLRFNCPMDEIDPRFSRRLVFPVGNCGHLLEQWAKGDPSDRHKLIGDLAEAVFKQTEKWCRRPPTPPAPKGGAPSIGRDRVEQFMAEQPQRMLHDEAHTTPPLARPGAAGYASAAAATGVEDGGVDIVERLIDWASSKDPLRPRVTALLGDFGMGKTVTCQLVCRRMIERVETGADGLATPVYFDLRDIPKPDRPEEITIEKLFTDLLRRTGETAPSAQEVIEFIRTRQALVIFDGLDEMTNKYSIDVARVIYRQLLSIVPAAVWSDDARLRRQCLTDNSAEQGTRGGPSILLSCRSQYFADFAAERGFLSDADRSALKVHEDIAVYTMLPFNGDQIRDYVNRNLPEADRERALSLIESTYDLSELARRPVLLKYIGELVHRLEEEKLAGRTINLARLYDILVRQAFERDAGKHVISVPEKKRLLERLALYLHTRQQEEISNDRLIDWLDGQIESNFPKLAAARRGAEGLKLSEVFVQDLRNATLLSRPGEGGFRFGHTSLREFFLASALYRAVIENSAGGEWNIALPSPETLHFLLQRHAMEEQPERLAFEENLPNLLRPGQPLAVRWLAFNLWRRSFEAGAILPRPDHLDCSNFELDDAELRGKPGQPFPLARSAWRGARLRQAEFEDVDLAEADFSSVDATGAWFSRCCLEGAEFGGATLDASIWRDCTLDRGALDTAAFSHAEAYRCTLGSEPWHPQDQPDVQARHWEVIGRNSRGATVLAAGEIDGAPVLAVDGGRGIQIVDSRTGAVLRNLIPASGGLRALACGQVRARPVAAGATHSGEVILWDLETGQQTLTIRHENQALGLSLAKMGEADVIVLRTYHGLVVWDASDGRLIRSWDFEHFIGPTLAAAEVGGDLVVVASKYRNATMWNARTGAEVRSFELNGWARFLCVVTLGGEPVLVLGENDDGIRILDLKSGRLLRNIEHGSNVVALLPVPSPSGMLLASAGRQGPIKLWSPRDGTLIRSFEDSDINGETLAVQMVDGRATLIAGGGDGVVRVWDAQTGRLLHRLGRKGASVKGLVPVVIEERTAVATGGQRAQVSDLRTGETIRPIRTDSRWASVRALAMIGGAPALLADYGDNKRLHLWDLSDGVLLRSFEVPADQMVFAAAMVEVDGDPMVAAVTGRDTVWRWDAATGQALEPLSTQGSTYSISAGIADSVPWIAAIASGSVVIWNARTGEKASLGGSSAAALFSPMAFASAGGRPLLAIGQDDGNIHLWNLRARNVDRILSGHQAAVIALSAANISGRPLLVSSAVDGSIRVWDCADGNCIAVVNRHGAYLADVALSEIDDRPAVVWTEGEFVGTTVLGGATTLAIPGVDATVTIHSGEGGDVRLISAGAEAWKHFYTSYETAIGNFSAAIDDLPREA